MFKPDAKYFEVYAFMSLVIQLLESYTATTILDYIRIADRQCADTLINPFFYSSSINIVNV